MVVPPTALKIVATALNNPVPPGCGHPAMYRPARRLGSRANNSVACALLAKPSATVIVSRSMAFGLKMGSTSAAAMIDEWLP